MNPRRVYSVFYVSLRELFRDKGGIFFTFLFPILLMLLFGFIFQDSGESSYDIYVQDQDGTDISGNLTMTFKHVDALKVHMIDANRDIDSYIDKNDVDFVLVIPEGYGVSMERMLSNMTGTTVPIILKYDPSVSSSSVKRSIVHSIIQETNKGLSGAVDIITLDEQSVVTEHFTYIEFFIPGVIGLTVMTGAVFGTIFTDTELRKKGIFRKLSTTPISRGEFILSNMIFQLFLALLATVEILLVGWILFGVALHLNPMFLAMILFEVFAFTGLAMIVVKFVKEAQAASALGNAITFPMMFLSGSFFDVDSMPHFLQVIARVLPLYYVNEGMRDAMIFNDYWESFVNLVPIAIFAVMVFIIGVTFTTWKQD
ncbi:MAG: ABC transporter permease [Candidatus Thermoplasmatota archaeon]|nr:ABC transporter permease [Candidatus Thermoplasmatota archaeon]